MGCTAGAETAAELFGGEDALTAHAGPSRFGSRAESMAGIMRALAPPDRAPPVRAVVAARKLPRAAREFKRLVPAFCEVGEMLSDRLGLSASVRALFVHFTERWDGKGVVSSAKGDEIPLPLRIAHVARDTAFQRMLGGDEFAARVIRQRAGGAFDPAIAEPARRRRRRDPRARARRLGVGGRARVRAEPSA